MVLSATLSNPSQQLERLYDLRTIPILSQPRSPAKCPKPLRRLAPEEIRDVVDRYLSGETMAQLGDRYGINRRTVSTYLQRSGIPSRHRTMDDSKIARCVELYESGLSLVAVDVEALQELRRRYSLSRSAVLPVDLADPAAPTVIWQRASRVAWRDPSDRGGDWVGG